MTSLISLALCLYSTNASVAFPSETNLDRKPRLVTTGDVFIKGARILTVSHGVIEKGNILVKGGKIVGVGNVQPPAGVPVIDATGKVVVPGWVDAHMHRGTDTTNEGSDSIVGECRIIDVLNPDNKNVWQALASGETTGMILHGSANPVGAESLVVKLKYGKTVNDLPIPDAPRMIKFALGENVTRSGSSTSTRFPHTRMGVEATYRRAFTQAREYVKKWDEYEAKVKKDPTLKAPQRDLRLETLGDILKRKIWVQCHSYRGDEILMMVRLSQDFGFKIGAMQHALESYKVAPELAKAGIGVSMFADEWAAKLELFDCIPFAASILTKAGVNVSINTDGTGGTTALNIDAAKAMRYGGLSEEQALRTLTLNPAKELGIDHRVGSIDVGKDGDLVIWDGHPLSVYSKVSTTIIEGEVMFQRRDAFGIDKSSFTKNKLDENHYVASPAVPANSNLYAIVGGMVHTVSGPVIDKGTVLIANGKIKAVGKNITIPSGYLKVDVTGKHVYPGFIDAGTTIGLTEFGQVGQATDVRELGNYQPDLVALTAVQVQSEHIPTTRAQGVTSVFTTPRGGSVSGIGSVLNLSGFTTEDLGLKRLAALSVNWPGGQNFSFDGDDDLCAHGSDSDVHSQDMGGAAAQGPDGGGSAGDIKSFFQKAAKYGRGHDTIDLGLEAMQPVFTKQMPVFVRVSSRSGIAAVVDWAKQTNLKVVLVGASDAWREAKLLADNKIPVILTAAGKSTLTANVTTKDWDPYDTPYVTPALLKKAGVKFCFQSDSYAEAKNLPERAAQSCAYGLSREDLLRSITLSAAEILGVDDKVGSLQVGKLANIVISDGDPCEMTGSIRNVFINGKPVSLDSKFTRLRDQYLQRLK